MTFDEAMQYMMDNPGSAVECKELSIKMAFVKPYFNPEEVIGDNKEPEPEDSRECFCQEARGNWFRAAPSNSFFRYEWKTSD